jgi:serine/threonine-protein kinase RsbW
MQVEQFARNAGLPQTVADAIGLVLNEALANIIRHGYGNREDQPILVSAEVREKELCLSIRDWGKKFDPSKLPIPSDDPPSPDKVKPGGLGLLCMHKLMDSAKFTQLEDGMLLELTKKLPARQ